MKDLCTNYTGKRLPISKKMLNVKKAFKSFFNASDEVLTKDLRNPIIKMQ